MRRLLAFGFSALIAAGVVAIFVLNIYSGRPSDAEQRAQQAAEAMTVLLTEEYELDLETLTAGRQLSDKRYDFRGALAGDLRGSAPIYGIVELTCAEVTADPQCWRLVTFERDGEIWSPAAGAKQEQAEAEIAAEAESGDRAPPAGQGEETPEEAPAATQAPAAESARPSDTDAGSTAAAEPADDAPETDEQATSSVGTESASLTPETPLPPQIFAVTSPVVNGRAGPGTEHAIVMKVTPEIRLELIERRENWGRFRVVEGAAATAEDSEADPDPEPWIWLQLVERRTADDAS